MTIINDYLSKYRKRIIFNYNGEKLFFDVNQTLFSSIKIDDGTFQLIDSLRKDSNIEYDKVLDLGCGYGPIGITIKKLHKDSIVHCTDRDSLAIDFTKHNSELNKCEVESYTSLDYENIKEKFTLICCNYPAKAGIKALKKIVYEASKKLEKNGLLAIVIVRELEEDFKSIMRKEIIVKHKKESSGHIVYHLKYEEEIDYLEEPYLRNKVNYKIEKKVYSLQTAQNLPEFETPSFGTEITKKILGELGMIKDLTIINPNQGHIALSAEHYNNPTLIRVVTSDLLSLKYTRENLKRNGFKNYEEINKVFIEEERGELLLWVVDEDLEKEQIKRQYDKAIKNYKIIIITQRVKSYNNTTKNMPKKIKRQYENKGFITTLIER